MSDSGEVGSTNKYFDQSRSHDISLRDHLNVHADPIAHMPDVPFYSPTWKPSATPREPPASEPLLQWQIDGELKRREPEREGSMENIR